MHPPRPGGSQRAGVGRLHPEDRGLRPRQGRAQQRLLPQEDRGPPPRAVDGARVALPQGLHHADGRVSTPRMFNNSCERSY